MTASDLFLIAEAREAARSGRGRRLREALELAQTEVAAAVKVSSPTISRWEDGTRVPSGERAVRWAKLLRAFEKRLAERAELVGAPVGSIDAGEESSAA